MPLKGQISVAINTEFSWEGYDHNDTACGRGWVIIGTAGRLVGHFFIHNADNSGFVCEPT